MGRFWAVLGDSRSCRLAAVHLLISETTFTSFSAMKKCKFGIVMSIPHSSTPFPSNLYSPAPVQVHKTYRIFSCSLSWTKASSRTKPFPHPHINLSEQVPLSQKSVKLSGRPSCSIYTSLTNFSDGLPKELFLVFSQSHSFSSFDHLF